MDIFKISFVELNFLLNFAKKKNISLFEALLDLNQPFLKQTTIEKLENFRKMVEDHLKKARKEQAGQILYDFLVKSGLYETLNETSSLKQEKRVQNIAKFFDRVKNFETERSDANIFTLAEWLNLMLQMGDSPLAAEMDIRDNNAVNILTVHSAKGLEFPVVFIANLVSDRFPTRERSEKIPLPKEIIKEKIPENSDFHLEEERRLFYVAITRAKEKLYFTGADYYGGGKRAKKLSPFIYEALPSLIKEETQKVKIKQLSLTEILSSYSEGLEEKEEEIKSTKVSYITYSNLQMFDICPLHYKAKVIFNLPTPPTAAQSFGISLHQTLYDFYKLVQDKKRPTLKDFNELLKKDWITYGYENKKQEEERLKQAKKILTNFYKTECNPPVTPISLEQPFSFSLKNGVKVFGKIDRVDKYKEGIEIIDYKTGEDNPKADAAHKLQLAIYALAATKVNDPNLNRKPEDIVLTIHFLEPNSKKSMIFKKEDLEKLEDDLITKINEIKKSDFKCSGNILCKNCEFKMLCSTFN